MKIGAENKKSVYALTVLGALAAYMVYSNFFAGPSYKPVTPPAARPDVSDAAGTAAPEKSSGPDISQAKSKVGRGTSSKAKNNGEFHPIFQAKKKEDRVDVSTVDPTIRFDLLERAMKVPPAGGERDLFQISKTPPKKEIADLAGETKVHPWTNVGPHQPKPPAPPPPPPPPTPMTIPFKFYGTSAVHPDGTRTAYFIIPGATPDADEILKADEGDVLKGHFRIVQIGQDKVLVEDTKDKRRQPLNMEKENTG